MEIKLVNVARASLEELLTDYHDFLRVRGAPPWDKDSKEALYVRNLSRANHRSHGIHESYGTYKPLIETRPPEVAANIVICLIHQANFLIDRQLKSLEQTFLAEGGLRERMTRARLAARGELHYNSKK